MSQPPPPPPQPLASAVSSLSLESYLQVHQALTKQGATVQPVTAIEEAFYRMADLRQVLHLHGLTAGKFNRAELLAALKGHRLVNPFCCTDAGGSSGSMAVAAVHTTPAAAHAGASLATVAAADACAVLGIVPSGNREPPVVLQLPQQRHSAAAAQPTTTAAPPQPPAQAAAAPGPAAAQVAPQPHDADTAATPSAAVTLTAAPTAGVAAPVRANPQPSQVLLQGNLAAAAAAAAAGGGHENTHAAPSQLQLPAAALLQALAALLPQAVAPQPTAAGGTHSAPQVPPAAAPPAAEPAPAASAAPVPPPVVAPTTAAPGPAAPAPTAPAPAPAPPPPSPPPASEDAVLQLPADAADQPHTAWLLSQLGMFAGSGARVEPPEAAEGGAAAAAAAAVAGGAGALLGGRVGFTLMDSMQVAGSRNTLLTVPPGVYQGMAVKFLGSSCQPELCEVDCRSQHQHYRARMLPPSLNSSSSTGGSAEGEADTAASLAQAHAALTGRPVLLILDLHPRLRVGSLQELLSLDPQQLQDAWVLLEEDSGGDEADSGGSSGDEEAAAAAAGPGQQGAGRKRARKRDAGGRHQKRGRA